jgi:hypothetical protein
MRYRARKPLFSFWLAVLGLVALNVLLAAILSPGALSATGASGGVVLYLPRLQLLTVLAFAAVTLIETFLLFEF